MRTIDRLRQIADEYRPLVRDLRNFDQKRHRVYVWMSKN